ncbi:MAG: Gfo/Idh/MocA family oxidoreductase [Clostridia bacterium]|nr:Gfo/Idh/MocA family oxidoreductase [Clostridia bacterium]
MKTYKVLLIGAGNRGNRYTGIMHKVPEKFKVVAVAEPIDRRRNSIKEKHGIADDMCFNSWQEALSQPKLADLAIISTMDEMHYEPALKAIELGYDLLLEKPVAQTAKECADIALAAEKHGVKVLVCHVLRYSPFYCKIKQLLMNGTIGDIMSVVAVEGVGNLHQSHSYVRGNWHKESETTPMLLAKCCHDIDILQWLLDKNCKKVQSFGSLAHFTPEYAPKGAPVRCYDGTCPENDTCPYNCKKLYFDDKNNSWFREACTKAVAKSDGATTDEEVDLALKTTDYGLCVYHANNDVVDHQVVNMEFEGGVTVNLSMNAFNKGGRYIRVFGTKGELYANMGDESITVYNFENKKHEAVSVSAIDESILSGHGGGDSGIVSELYEYLSGDYKGVSAADIKISVKNHLIGFAAEKSRRNDTVESIDKFFKEYGFDND